MPGRRGPAAAGKGTDLLAEIRSALDERFRIAAAVVVDTAGNFVGAPGALAGNLCP
jgi:hypothetical protein